MVECLLIIVIFSGMAYVEILGEHIKVDVLVGKFPPVAQKTITVSANLLTASIIAILSWQCLRQGQFLITSGYHSGILRIPQWPFALISSFFIMLFALAAFTNFLESLAVLLADRTRNYLWLIPGVFIVVGLLTVSMKPDIITLVIEESTFGIISLLVLFMLIFFRVHVGAAMAMTGLWGMAFLTDSESGLSLLGMVSQTVASNYVWSVAPLFMLMGVLVAASEFSRDLYNAAYKWLGHMRGGLASATLAACAAFAAVVGDSLSGVITMGTIALPEMKKFKYNIKLATGCIAVGGSLGILIPPSLGFIVYGLITEQSIGRLFLAGFLPGVLALISLIIMVYVRCRLNPLLGPAGPKFSIIERIVSVKKSSPVFAMFFLVMGGIWLGFFTPTEAGAIGAFSAIVFGLILRRLNFASFIESLISGIKLTSVIFFIFVYATAFTQYLTVTQLPVVLANFVSGLDLPAYGILSVILFVYLLLGCVMNALPVLILTLPVVFPTVISLGFDPIWFGVLLVILVEIGQITPPIGMSVFALQGVAKDVPMYTVFAGVFPFWIVLIGVIIILIVFPEICLFLPNLMMG
ncbi:MAG: hypothetical protein DRI24_02860 [Deltaproteobacteria bacterium]|nr:MAG: hypothetical protein DRI24_02860 [Deltaproteobacteria bacterium]